MDRGGYEAELAGGLSLGKSRCKLGGCKFRDAACWPPVAQLFRCELLERASASEARSSFVPMIRLNWRASIGGLAIAQRTVRPRRSAIQPALSRLSRPSRQRMSRLRKSEPG